MKICLYGGSFNPPHLMHEKIATTLLKRKLVDKIIFLPTSNFYPKSDLIDANIRLKMLKLITNNHQNMEVSDYEFQKRTFTYETLQHFKELYPNDEIIFLLGTDNLNEIDTWKNYEEILNYKLLVIARPNVPLKLKKKIQKYSKNIEFLNFPLEDLSSTEIRKLLQEKKWEELKEKVNEKVLKFIKENKIYDKIKEEDVVNERSCESFNF